MYFVDVDRLKAVNDMLGHRAGDLLIRSTADRLSARVGPRVTRFGGDEFVLVVEDARSANEAEELGRRIVADLARPIEVEGNHVRSSASVGLTLADRSTTPDELLRRADVALYRAKALGRSCLATYSVDEDRGLDADLDLEPELRRAVDRDEFTLHYQPIIDLPTGQVVSVEALLRWEHPRRGQLGPADFLDQAISSGLLGAIGESSLRRACADFASIDPTGFGHALPSVAVNLSSSELADRRVVARVAAALADSGLAPRRLTLEITEDVIIDESVRSTIDELRALGVYLAIDDFGTGNSSLRQLGTYPAAVLKVDKSFVDRIEVDERARAITAAIIRMSRNLGLTTVAEGVETAGQADLLARMGCDRAQGWLISKAMPFEELTGWCVTNCRIGPYRDRPGERVVGLVHDAGEQLGHRRQVVDRTHDLTGRQDPDLGVTVDDRRLGHHRGVGGERHLGPGELLVLAHLPGRCARAAAGSTPAWRAKLSALPRGPWEAQRAPATSRARRSSRCGSPAAGRRRSRW